MTDDIKAIRDALAAGPVAGEWHAAEYTDHDGPPACDDIAVQASDPRRFIHLETLLTMDWSDKPPMVAAFTRTEAKATAAYIAACHPERIARLLDALEAATRDAERYRWLRQVAEGEASDGEHCPLIKLYGLQGDAEAAFLLKAPHLTAAIDAAMKRGA